MSDVELFPRLRSRSHAEAGADLLEGVVARRSELTTDALFAELWRAVENNGHLFDFRQMVYNRFQLPWRNIIFDDLARDVHGFRPDFRLKVVPADLAEAARIFGGTDPLVAVSIHSGVALAVLRLIDVLGRGSAVIAARTPNRGSTGLFDFTRAPRIIQRSPDCLIEARHALREGRVLGALVDYALADPITRDTTIQLSPSAFGFASALRATLVFAYPSISSDGSIRFQLQSMKATGPAEGLVSAFRHFIAPLRSGSADWQIGDWAGETGGLSYAVRGAPGVVPADIETDD